MRLIDADALKKLMEEECAEECAICCYANSGDGCRCKLIDNVPTVEYPFYQEAYQTGYEEGKNERPHGEWIYTDKEDKKKGYGGYCSVCKCDMPIGINDWKQEYYESNFCPNCGAEMRGEEE